MVTGVGLLDEWFGWVLLVLGFGFWVGVGWFGVVIVVQS